jgi:hypothetical protein
MRVDLQVPTVLVGDLSCSPAYCSTRFTLNQGSGDGGARTDAFSGVSFGGVVYVNRNQ